MLAIWIHPTYEVPSLSEKAKVLSVIRKGKKKHWNIEITKIYGKSESSVREIVMKEKAFMLVLLPHLE